MGEPRGKLEQLVAELEAKKAEVERVLKEFDLILPHLQQSLQALDKAGFTDTGATEVPQAPKIQEVPRPEQQEKKDSEQKRSEEEVAKAAEEKEAAKDKEAEAAKEKEAEAAKEKEAAAAKEKEAAAEGEPAEGEGEEEPAARRSIASLVGGGE